MRKTNIKMEGQWRDLKRAEVNNQGGRELQKIVLDGEDSSRGQSKLSDVVPTSQGAKGGTVAPPRKGPRGKKK